MKPIIITGGDPTGISEEILIDSIKELKYLSTYRPVYLISTIESSKIPDFIGFTDLVDCEKTGLFLYRSKEIEKLRRNCGKLGKPNKYSGEIAFGTLHIGIDLQKKIKGDMITLPLSKEWVIKSGVKHFIGHTEELSKSYKTDTFMMMMGSRMKVIPLTTHIPIRKVPKQLKNIKLSSLIRILKKNPLIYNSNIGFCGLNPHAGEDGKIGKEEPEIISPMIQSMKKKGLKVEGPLAADSVFTKQNIEKYDLILSCYHDQGLIPFKALEGMNGVNVTLGLDFTRVSPDHGTAFDIAGKGIAKADSFKKCIKILKSL